MTDPLQDSSIFLFTVTDFTELSSKHEALLHQIHVAHINDNNKDLN